MGGFAISSPELGPSPVFAHSGFLRGVASVLDVGGFLVEYNYTNSGEQADLIAARLDWFKIEKDFREAVTALQNERREGGQEGEQEQQA